MSYAFWADVIGIFHALIVLYVIGGEALILTGWRRDWAWTRHVWLRRFHAAAVAVVMGLAVLGVWCPLTVWESELRERAGQAGYEQGFIATWLDRLLYYDAPLAVFAAAYALFAALVAWTYWKYPPRRK